MGKKGRLLPAHIWIASASLPALLPQTDRCLKPAAGSKLAQVPQSQLPAKNEPEGCKRHISPQIAMVASLKLFLMGG